ncbi:Pyridoxine/pyridoxamine 5'-phosphate oxidase [Microbacterium oxydans]|uniref:Pyridoxine/pyridoxamine 5'-phosphate oxidase n=1 Tax=Microbacterium oxydans TaxID=82380 RepID=A0A0F0L873_9MICO|nr:pyridoxamine 5'-phosphate oxidase family protein [Microbacterium oxydans]KJL27731.1 Pyridoxine/pyridoxamine 5'-phosphate oxidase [Microbacterium oxydans]CAH0141937.1 Pyridoxine/pyridoxamine 5'-phosphate oxidase [Microbacterium oxydans]
MTSSTEHAGIASLNDWLRGRHALTGATPRWDLEALPEDPLVLFEEWILRAEADGVPEPHTATLATVDVDGIPDARTLILKRADARGWAIASKRSSRKGAQLEAVAAAALNFWWQPQVRAVRVRGAVVEATPEESAADLAARSAAARADVQDGDWVLWRIVPTRIEFWQGSRDRRHTRVVYERPDGAWTHGVLRD